MSTAPSRAMVLPPEFHRIHRIATTIARPWQRGWTGGDRETSCPYSGRDWPIRATSDMIAQWVGGVRAVLGVPMFKDDEVGRCDLRSTPEVRRLPKSKSSWSRTSPPRRSSRSRTRGCSTSCASAPTILPSRWSSRPRPAEVLQSSPARQASWSRCSTQFWRTPGASARRNSLI